MRLLARWIFIAIGVSATVNAASPPFSEVRSVSLTPANYSVLDFQTATDDFGNTVAVWSINNGSNVVLQTSYKQVGHDWTHPLPGNPLFQHNGPQFLPTLQRNILTTLLYNVLSFQLVVDRSGNAVVVWQIFNGFNTVLQAAYKPFGEKWQVPGNPTLQNQILSSVNYNVGPFQVAIFSGNVVLAWQIFNGIGPFSHGTQVVQAAYKPNDMPWQLPGPPNVQQNIVSELNFNVTQPPAVAVDQLGNAAVVWQINNNFNNVVQAAFRPVTKGKWKRPGIPTLQANILSTLLYNVITAPTVTLFSSQATFFWNIAGVNTSSTSQGLPTVLQSATVVFP